MYIAGILWRNRFFYNGISLRIEGDEPPQEDPKASAIPSDGVKEPEPSPRDSEISSECQEVDYDTDFEDNASDTEQDKGTTRWTSVVIHSIYRKVSNVRRTKSQNLNASRLI